jgi:hypothetical protein
VHHDTGRGALDTGFSGAVRADDIASFVLFGIGVEAALGS